MTHYNAIFVSDVHLGMRSIDSSPLLSFLLDNECNHLYLVGDIVDGWALKKKFNWPDINNQIIQEIYKKYKNGTKVYYLTGNHDELLRTFHFSVDNFVLSDKVIHKSVKGTNYLVIHGDSFDAVIEHAKWLAIVGAVGYEFIFRVNTYVNKIRNKFGYRPITFSKYIKRKIKKVVLFIESFEEHLVDAAKQENVDGVICGHIHFPKIENIDGVEYINCGDTVESQTLITEDHQGNFKIHDLNKI